jgi:hypothetical protein
MHHSELAEIFDPSNGLTCHFVSVSSATQPLVDQLREMYVARADEFGYVGFSYEVDDIFHLRSTYIYVTNGEKVVMVCRATPRPPGTFLPFEMGIREDGGSYKLGENEKAADLASYTHVKGYYQKAFPLLAAGMGRYLKAYGAPTAYSLYDLSHKKVEQIHLLNGWVPSSRFPEPVYFPTFCRHTDAGSKPVLWKITEWDSERITYLDRTASESF